MMRELLLFLCGIAVGVVGFYAIQCLYNWIESLRSKVERLRFELGHYQMQRELWTEFQFWKREQKGKE